MKMMKTPRLLALLALFGLLLAPMAGLGLVDAEERMAARSRVEDSGVRLANRGHIISTGTKTLVA